MIGGAPRPSAGAVYGRALATAAAGDSPPAVRVRAKDGHLQPLALDRFVGPLDWSDRLVARDVRGPVLDVGCGPGRMLEALRAHGTAALGVDVSPEAVLLARSRGGEAHIGSIFGDVPFAGTFASALLLDGNIGIGGEPAALLARIGELLSADGVVVADVSPPGVRSGRQRLRLEAPDGVSDWFPWATVSLDAVPALARAAGFSLERHFDDARGRHLVWLRRMHR